VAKGNAAIHAPGALRLEVALRHVLVKFLPVGNAAERRTVFGEFALKLQESSGFSHVIVI
jgi:hypothetical protein